MEGSGKLGTLIDVRGTHVPLERSTHTEVEIASIAKATQRMYIGSADVDGKLVPVFSKEAQDGDND
jgi:hypothetical protein